MRVTQLLGSSAGGVAQHVAQISSLLSHDNTDVLIASPSTLHDKFSSIARHQAVEIADRPQLSDIQVVRQLRHLAGQTDVMHAHGLRAAALAGIAVRTLPKARRPRFIVTLHNMPVGSKHVHLIAQVLEKIVARTADAVVGVSMDIVDHMKNRGAHTQGRALVPAPVLTSSSENPAKVRQQLVGELDLPADSSIVLTIARLAPQKGLDTLISAAQILQDSTSRPCVWLVAGDGPLAPQLNNAIEENNAPVVLLGRRNDIAELLHASDVVVNAAVWEGQPIAVQEALQAGKAIVATDAGGTREVTGDAAILTEVSNAAEMAAAIHTLLHNPEEKAAYEQRAKKQADTLPTAAEVLASLHQLYGGEAQ
ncbi:glycosyltransferase [Timonella sp. A28]|uniref:glycosyltransferase n=1 Tax=Timonella sp. A28 TaxID=3442640 RepID=UPI003EB88A69